MLGFLLPLAATAAYFAWHGAFADLIFYSWTYNTKYYVPEVPLAGRLTGIFVPFQLLNDRMPVALLLIVLGWAGVLWTALRRLGRTGLLPRWNGSSWAGPPPACFRRC
ncbi:MAG: hypothetical protein WDM96_02940 [Lacunisphaera sp.]